MTNVEYVITQVDDGGEGYYTAQVGGDTLRVEELEDLLWRILTAEGYKLTMECQELEE